jgi:hypothetical protein
VEEGGVERFGQVVTALVGVVDAVLYSSKLGIGNAGVAGFVFNVPELEIGAMLAGDGAEPAVCRGITGFTRVMVFLVPCAGSLVLQFDNCGSGEHDCDHSELS